MFSHLLRHTRLVIPAIRSNASLAHARCPSCSSPLPTALPTCPKCKYIAPLPSSMSFYQYFNILESPNPFSIDVRDLRRRFLQTQRLCHPDAWAQRGETALALAAAQSSQLNKAYQTLLSPLHRAQYILSLHGVEESETGKLEDEELITEVLEARQEVEEASSLEEISRIKDANQERIHNTVKEIERLIGQKDWINASLATVRLKYWLGIREAAMGWTPG